MTDKPFGIDISKYQSPIDWNVIAKHIPKVEFIGIRATIGTTYQDPAFKSNWEGAKSIGLLRMAYHVLYPELLPSVQIDNLLSLFPDGYDGEFPLVLDCELDHGCDKHKIANCIVICSGLIKNKTGRLPIIYSRAGWIDDFTIEGIWHNQYDWWLAQYLKSGVEHPGPPRLPKGVDSERCVIHQTADHTPGFGVASKQLDYDRWQGDLDSLYKYANEKPVRELTDKEKLDALWKAHPELNKIE